MKAIFYIGVTSLRIVSVLDVRLCTAVFINFALADSKRKEQISQLAEAIPWFWWFK